MKYFVHPQGICESKKIGENTRIWAFAHVLPGAKIGKNCNICDHTFIENDVTIGNNVTIKSGVYLWDGITLEDNVFVGPSVAFTNDKFPRSKVYPKEFLKIKIEKGASLGANCTILPGITIGQNAMIGSGSVVTHSVPANAIVVGNPANITGYINSNNIKSGEISNSSTIPSNLISGCKIITLNIIEDLRGNLVASELNQDLPFKPKRMFYIYNVPSKKIRGEHAHKTCEQFLLCMQGNVTCLIDDGKKRMQIELNKPNLGLYMPAMIWGSQFNYSNDAILLCFASKKYDNQDYIRDYREFLKHCEK